MGSYSGLEKNNGSLRSGSRTKLCNELCTPNVGIPFIISIDERSQLQIHKADSMHTEVIALLN